MINVVGEGQRSDAIIVLARGDPLLVPLTRGDEVLSKLLKPLSEVRFGSGGLAEHDVERKLMTALRHGWEILVEPIVDVLENQIRVPLHSRIWWCPIRHLGTFPLHACGPYRGGQRNLQDRYISSYIPTIGTLLGLQDRASRMSDNGVPPKLRSLVISQAFARDEPPLPGVSEEIKIIQTFIPSLKEIKGEECTSGVVLEALQDATWVHFSCHGHSEPGAAFNSRFSLNGPLKLLDLMKVNLSHADLAYLSACHTAACDLHMPDEGLSLAGGMLFAGFKSVVGTMWACTDEDNPIATKAFYKHMTRNGIEKADYRDSAAALVEATKELRRRKVPLERWICYVHYGL